MFDILAMTLMCAPLADTQTITAIIQTESNSNPFAIGINGKVKLARQPKSEDEAISTARWLIDNKYNIDMGLGQINYSNLDKLGLTVDSIFDPCTNIAAAAKIFNDNYVLARKKTLDDKTATYQAISAYNTGSFTRGFSNGYVQKVISASSPIPLLENSEKQREFKLKKLEIKPNLSKNSKSIYENPGSDEQEKNVYNNNIDNTMVYQGVNYTIDTPIE